MILLKSQTVPDTTITGWIEEIKAGNADRVPDVIIQLADFPRVCSRYLRRIHPWLDRDLLSASNEALVVAVNEIANRGQSFVGTNVWGYVTISIRNACHRCLEHSQIVHVPHRAYMAAKEKALDYVIADIRTAFDYVGSEHHRGATIADACADLGLDQIDTKIIHLLDEGYKQCEAAAEVGMTGASLNERLSKIKSKYRASLKKGKK